MDQKNSSHAYERVPLILESPHVVLFIRTKGHCGAARNNALILRSVSLEPLELELSLKGLGYRFRDLGAGWEWGFCSRREATVRILNSRTHTFDKRSNIFRC